MSDPLNETESAGRELDGPGPVPWFNARRDAPEPDHTDTGAAWGWLMTALMVACVAVPAGLVLWTVRSDVVPRRGAAASTPALTHDCPGPQREGDRTVVVVRLSNGQLVTTCRRITDPMSPERKP